MSLTVEDGSVVTDADCYETAADTASRIALFDPSSSFAGKTETQQEAIIRRRTTECENKIRSGVEGVLVERGQARLFPRARCYTSRGRALDNDEIPESLMAGIAFRCEDDAAGRIPASGKRIKSHSSVGGSVTFDVAGNGSRFEDSSPEAWGHLSQLFWTS